MDFLKPFNDCEIAAINEDDNDQDWSGESYFEVCSPRYKDVDLDCKRRAVEFWNNNEKRHKLGIDQHNSKLVSYEGKLRRCANQLEVGETRKNNKNI